MSPRWGGGRQSRASRFAMIRYSVKPADARLTGHNTRSLRQHSNPLVVVTTRSDIRWVDDRMMWGRLCAWMTESVATTTATLHRTCLRHIPIFVYATFRSLQPPPPRMTSSFASGVIECKGLKIRPIRGGYMLTNQRRVSVDQSERRSSKFDQSEPSSRMRMRCTLLTV